MRKKMISILLCLCLILAMGVSTAVFADEPVADAANKGAAWTNPFTDVAQTDWFYDAVGYTVTKGLFSGTSDATFSPDESMTRGMLVSVLYRMEKEPIVMAANTFTDVSATAYYCNAVVWAAENGVVGGYGNSLFGPDDPITHEQLAAILYRYAQSKGKDVSAGENTNILSYNDFDQISEYAIPAMQWACGTGLVRDDGTGLLKPKDNASRAEVAYALMMYDSAAK